MTRLFADHALQTMREEIAASNGNEVFFLGKTDESRLVVAVEPLARGNRDTVAAIMITAVYGDVVIHNHPSGNLEPSTADLEIAATAGNQGIGFYIVDNRAEHVYQVVSPFSRKQIARLPLAEIDAFFQPGGKLSANLAGYEYREEQCRMALAVSEAFNGDRVAVIEAGTGTGKSLAYLLPAALWAKSNRERVVVSTNTINLQEQLTGKDIPFLQKYGKVPFRAALVKGRGNYLCRRKLAARREEPGLFPDEQSELQAIVAWSETTASGCRDDLGFVPGDELWEEVCSEGDQCGRTKCNHYGRCHFYNSRRAAAAADVLVVNHALLLADLSLREHAGSATASILPPFQRLVIDEAHHLEDVATGTLSSRITRNGLLKLLARLQHPRRPERGLLPRLAALLNRPAPAGGVDLTLRAAAILDQQLFPLLPQVVDAVGRELDGIGYALGGQLRLAAGDNGEQKLRLTAAIYGSDFWEEALERINRLSSQLHDFSNGLAALLQAVAVLPDRADDRTAGIVTDIRGLKGRIDTGMLALLHFIGHEGESCRWFEMKRGKKGLVVRLCSSPLAVAPTLKRVLFDRLRTVIMTSATLAVGNRFDYLETRTGVSLLPTVRVSELLLASPFDYGKQAFVGVPADLPEPTDRLFEPAAADFILKTMRITLGRAFVLFTSYDLLKRVHGRLAPELQAMGLVPLRQGESSRQLLLARFKETAGAVLFGTDSFWEGVDVQGEALELVIITRLPFRVPTEPILEARSEHISAKGGDPFREYTVPQAVIKFKQGFGRLIRSRYDRGAVLILDRRVLIKNYGKIFLQSLPEVPVAAAAAQQLLADLQTFY